MNRRKQTSGFSLVELLVVVAIMALLIGIALPSFRGAKRAAKEQSVRGLINATDAAIQTFLAEQALGGSLPPSASDVPDGQIIDPVGTNGVTPVEVRTSGASLIVYALAGPDKQGTTGFKPAGAAWGALTGGPGSPGGMYNPANNVPRYGPYAGAKLLDSITPLKQVEGMNKASLSVHEERQRVFLDDFKMPLLYYRARKAARQMITRPSPLAVGIYDHRDNALVTGGLLHNGGGSGGVSPVSPHLLSTTDYPGDSNFCMPRATAPLGTPQHNFDEYIWDDQSISDRSRALEFRPVRATEYLLISAGSDRIYGTKDDVRNW